MKNAYQEGEVITCTAESGGVVSGQPYLVGSLVVIATETVAQTLPYSAAVTGVFQVTKTASQAWAEGVKVYLDVSPREFTTSAGGNTLCGVAAAAATSGAALVTGYVRLDGVCR